MKSYSFGMDGNLLKRGFWLYLIHVRVNSRKKGYFYVGMTGDTSSTNAASFFSKLGRHLGNNRNNNTLRKRLDEKKIDASDCNFVTLAIGPLFDEINIRQKHIKIRRTVSYLEKCLLGYLKKKGLYILNKSPKGVMPDKYPDDFKAIRGIVDKWLGKNEDR